MKNGRIIWDNAPGTHADLGGTILFSQDLNQDHKIDLLIYESDRELSLIGKGPKLYYLYIFSWDGKEGRFLNTFLENGKSAIIGENFDIDQKDKKGIKVITAALPDLATEWDEYRTRSFPKVTYTWNGKQYGLWMKGNGKQRSARIRPFFWREEQMRKPKE